MTDIRRGGLGRPSRKPSLRLKTWDYSLPGPYFFTICAFERRDFFGDENIREEVIEIFKKIAEEFEIVIHGMVVAANHGHGLLTLSRNKNIKLWQYIGKAKVRTTQMYREIGQASRGGLGRPKPEGQASRGGLGRPKPEGQASLPLREPLREEIWQRSFYDHIIRDEKDFLEKARYIENHPIKEPGTIFAEWH